jgi:hypothetical protein
MPLNYVKQSAQKIINKISSKKDTVLDYRDIEAKRLRNLQERLKISPQKMMLEDLN